jgi:hypothetical protein
MTPILPHTSLILYFHCTGLATFLCSPGDEADTYVDTYCRCEKKGKKKKKKEKTLEAQ